MPYYVIRTVNSTFDVTDEGRDYPDVESAYAAAVNAGVDIAAEEVKRGRSLAQIEICIEDGDGQRMARGIVSVATSPLDNA